MAELGAREEPVPTEDLGRLTLALHRIESADRLRIEREQAAADAAAAHAGLAARAASMTHGERVETVRRALAGHLFPGRTDPPPAAFGWAAASAEDSPVTPPKPEPDPPTAAPPAHSRVTPPEPPPDSPADDGAHDVGDAGGAPDVCDPRGVRDTWDAHRARDAELRRRERESRLWADRPSLLPCGVERARVKRGGLVLVPTSPCPPPPKAEGGRRRHRPVLPLRPWGRRGPG